MALLHLLSYVGALAAFIFVTLSLASGLLWLAELIEEHSRYAKVVGVRGIYTIIAIHVLLLYTDSLPVLPTFLSIGAHLLYLSNFTASWPVISLSSPKFIASCLVVIADHFTWFFHFANKASEARRKAPSRYTYGGKSSAGKVQGEHGFMDVAAFFGICVWAAPLFLFLSLSANDNALPSMASAPPSPSGGISVDLSSPALGPHGHLRRSGSSVFPRTSLVKSLLEPIVSLLPRVRRGGRKRDDEGLLAPRTPIRGSPLHSPVPMGMASPSGGGGYFPWGSDGNRPSTPNAYGQASGSGTGGQGSSRSSSQGYGSGSSNTLGLSPESAKSHSHSTAAATASALGLTPTRPPGAPPPRRVQSEIQVTQSGSSSGSNPRGIATRNGQPVVTDAMLDAAGAAAATADPSTGISSSARTSADGLAGGMSLGPRGGDRIGGAEILESTGLTKRKAD